MFQIFKSPITNCKHLSPSVNSHAVFCTHMNISALARRGQIHCIGKDRLTETGLLPTNTFRGEFAVVDNAL